MNELGEIETVRQFIGNVTLGYEWQIEFHTIIGDQVMELLSV